MIAKVKIPEIGESITEGILVEWSRKDGAYVVQDEPLFVLETDKVTLTVNAEHAGLLKTLVEEGAEVTVGQSVATIDTEAEKPETPEALEPEVETIKPPPTGPPRSVPQEPGPLPVEPAGVPQAEKKVARMAEEGDLSPAVRRMVDEFNLDPAAIEGTGKGGRITKEDVVKHIESRTAPPAPAPSAARQTHLPMSPIRQRIAERLVAVQNEAAILTTFNEADMTKVMAWRELYKDAFQAKHGVSLGFMAFFLKAAVDALMTVPGINAQIQGGEIVQNHYYDIGVAVGTDRGLVVPVVRGCDQLTFAQVELAVKILARKAQEKSLTLDDLSGGVFTVSNGGVYGNLLSTPILNPPQSGILGMHAIKRRPVAVGDEVVIRPMMYLALSYDHRIVDGREAVTFLKRIVECIENPERMMLDI